MSDELDQNEIDRLLDVVGDEDFMPSFIETPEENITKPVIKSPVKHTSDNYSYHDEINWERIEKSWYINRAELETTVVIGGKKYHRDEYSNFYKLLS